MSISTRVACNGKGRNGNKEAYLFVIFILTIILFCILIVGCKKEELPEKLPELTSIGANTFGCMINNEIYIPEHRKVTFALNPIIIEYPIPPEYYFAVHTNRITNNSDTINNAAISFNANNINKPGHYVINYGKVKYNGAYYNTDSLNGGIVTITLIDSIKNIISGTFYFTAMNEYSKVVIKVSNGRFDLNKQ